MSSRIWKYPLVAAGTQMVSLPADAKPLAVDFQGEQLSLWVELDPHVTCIVRAFAALPTGFADVPYAATYVGTASHEPAGLVFHVYEVPAS